MGNFGLVFPIALAAALGPAPVAYSIEQPQDPAQLTRTIAFYEDRVREDPEAAIAQATLSSLYLQRSAETGDDDARRAEGAARASIAIRSRRNGVAYLRLAQSLLAQHRFADARAAASRALEMAPHDIQALCLVGDIELELGRLAAVDEILHRLERLPPHVNGTMLRAQRLIASGELGPALDLLRTATRQARELRGLSADKLAWYYMRLGRALALAGHRLHAQEAYKEALEIHPRDYRSMVGLSEIAASEGEWRDASRLAERAMEIAPHLEVVAWAGDMLAARGQTDAASKLYLQVEEMIAAARRAGSTSDDRHIIEYYLAHDRRLPEALRMARREYRLRKDFKTYDLLAWACLKNGRPKEARAIIEQAVAAGARNPALLPHARAILTTGAASARRELLPVRDAALVARQ